MPKFWLPFWFYNKKNFFSIILVEYFFKNIDNLRIKMFYQNPAYSFLLYYLSFVWIKFHAIMSRFTRFRPHESWECFSKNYWTNFLALQNFPHRRTPRSETMFWDLKPFKKWWKMLFYFTFFFFLKIVNFLYWRFGQIDKRLDWKNRVNF